MTLIDCLKKLFKEDDVNPLSPEEMRVYMTLLKEWNRLGRPEWFEYSLIPKAIPKVVPNVIPKSTLIRIRERLCQRGLIQYVSGNGKVKNPCYNLSCETKGGTKAETNLGTNIKEKVSPIPPLKEIYSELREKERISKDIPKKEEWDIDFALPSFRPIMIEWLAYKKSKGQNYKDNSSIRKCYQNLIKLSDNNPTVAQMIVDHSIANNWAGLFELKINAAHQTNYSDKRSVNNQVFQDFIAEREQRANGMAYEVEKPF
jgi:hypothetical protein